MYDRRYVVGRRKVEGIRCEYFLHLERPETGYATIADFLRESGAQVH